MGIPLCIIFCFPLLLLICTLCVWSSFIWLVCILGCFALGLSCRDSLGFLDLGGYFLPRFREVLNYYLLKYFLMALLFFFFFWDSCDLNVGAFNIVSEVSEIVFISFNSVLFFPLWFIYFHHSIFQLTYPISCLSCSTVISLQSAFDLSYCIIHYWLTLFYFLSPC